MRMAVAVNVMINVHGIKIQCAVRAVRHTTINAGRGSATAKDLRTTPVSTIREAVKVSKTVNCRFAAVIDTDISPRLACIDMNSIYYDVLKLEINLSLTFVYKCDRF